MRVDEVVGERPQQGQVQQGQVQRGQAQQGQVEALRALPLVRGVPRVAGEATRRRH